MGSWSTIIATISARAVDLLTMVLKPFSWCLGLLDFSYYVLNSVLGVAAPKFFSKGMGDIERAHSAQTEMLKNVRNKKDLSCVTISDDDIIWDEAKKQQGNQCVIEKASFCSPAADILPEASKNCQFYRVQPDNTKKDTNKSGSEVYILMLPATGEMGKSARVSMAKYFAKHFGWTSIIVTAPYYAARKPSDQRLFFLNTVGDTLAQSQAIIQEAVALIRHCLATSKHAKVCVTGFSWGAAMSSSAVAIALQCLDPTDGRRIALVPYVGSHSPVCLANGILESSLDWTSLRRKDDESYMQTKARLVEELEKTKVSDVTETMDNQYRSLAVLRATFMSHDHFIQKEYSLALFRSLQDMGTASDLKMDARWLPGGHITAMFFRRWVQRESVIAAIQDLNTLAYE